MARRSLRRAFTLIELITVMAITAVLLTVITVPIVQSFNLTRAAQGFANAQSVARRVMTQLEREISNSAGVRDNSGLKGSLYVMMPDNAGTATPILLSYVKMDLFKPAQGDPMSRVGSDFIDPDTGKVDPTLQTTKGQVQLPGVPGDTIVRYFIARRDPFANYNNPFTQYRTTGGGRWLTATGRDNLYVLMRAEVQPYVYEDIGGVPQRVVNSRFFIDQDRDADPNTSGPLMDDPTFADPLARAALGISPAMGYAVARPYDPADRDAMVRNWMQAATVVTEISRFDMVMPVANRQTQQVQFEGNRPLVVPLVRFQPTRLNSEAAEAQLAIRPTEETDNPAKVGPDVYKTQYGAWADAYLRILPSIYTPATGPLDASAGAVRPVYAGGSTIDMLPDANGHHLIYTGAGPVFDVTYYRDHKAAGAAYPFYSALNLGLLTASVPARQEFIAVVPEPGSGKVFASFDIREYGTDLTWSGTGTRTGAILYDERIPSSSPNDPGVFAGPAVTPADPTFTAGPAWSTYTTPNERFARLWHQWDSLWPNPMVAPSRDDLAAGVKRYIDLRAIPQAGSSAVASPLSPGLLPRISITPGSEQIFGPDQTPGPNYGKIVRYTRVPNVDSVTVGPNQYKINYTDRKEPNWEAQFGFTGVQYEKENYTANDFVSAVLQPRYRAGYVELNSRYGEPIPAGNIYITYRFQFTEPNDVVSVDYGSTELMEVVLTIRNWAQTTLPNPPIVTVRGTAAVRNRLR